MSSFIRFHSMRVSIVMPVRNAAEWLGETLESIARQTLPDYELIAINDHSDDATVQILNAAAANDTRIRLVENSGRGLVDALNTGCTLANAPYLARMDADDFMPPDRLRLQLEYLERHPHAAVVTGKVEHWGDAGLTAGYSRYVDFINSLATPDDYRLRQFIESPVAHPSVMLRRSILPPGPYRNGDFPEDYDLWLRLLASGMEFHSLPQPVLKWRDHPTRTSRIDPRYDTEKFYRHKAGFIAAWLKKNGHAAVTVWSGGRRTRRRIDALREAGVQITRYVDIHPRRVGQIIGGVPVIHPDSIQPGHGGFILVYVASTGARETIAAWLAQHGFAEGIHFLFAA